MKKGTNYRLKVPEDEATVERAGPAELEAT